MQISQKKIGCEILRKLFYKTKTAVLLKSVTSTPRPNQTLLATVRIRPSQEFITGSNPIKLIQVKLKVNFKNL